MTIRRILETGGEHQRLTCQRRVDGLFEIEIDGKQYAYDADQARELAQFILAEAPEPLPEYLR